MESVGYYENNSQLNEIFYLTEPAKGRLPLCRIPKPEYKESFELAAQSVVANHTALKVQASQESAARRKVIELAFSVFDIKALAAFYAGLLTGKVMTSQVPQSITPFFKRVSDVHSDVEDGFKVLILEILSQKIAES